MSKRSNYYSQNFKALTALCKELGLEWDYADQTQSNLDQIRVLGMTHVIDFWPARMVYHRISGENIKAKESYHHELDEQFNKQQVKKLLETGTI